MWSVEIYIYSWSKSYLSSCLCSVKHLFFRHRFIRCNRTNERTTLNRIANIENKNFKNILLLKYWTCTLNNKCAIPLHCVFGFFGDSMVLCNNTFGVFESLIIFFLLFFFFIILLFFYSCPTNTFVCNWL